MLLIIYSGSLQFALMSLISSNNTILLITLLSVSISFRQVFYGIGLFDKYKELDSIKKNYSIFALTDESYSLISFLDLNRSNGKI